MERVGMGKCGHDDRKGMGRGWGGMRILREEIGDGEGWGERKKISLSWEGIDRKGKGTCRGWKDYLIGGKY